MQSSASLEQRNVAAECSRIQLGTNPVEISTTPVAFPSSSWPSTLHCEVVSLAQFIGNQQITQTVSSLW